MKNLRLKALFIVVIMVGMATLYFMKSRPDYGIRPQDFTPDKIKKIEVKRVSDQKVIALTDPTQYLPIVNQMLKAKDYEAIGTKSNHALYYLRFYFTDNPSELVGLKKSPEDNLYFFYKSSHYKNDSLFRELDSLRFE